MLDRVCDNYFKNIHFFFSSLGHGWVMCFVKDALTLNMESKVLANQMSNYEEHTGLMDREINRLEDIYMKEMTLWRGKKMALTCEGFIYLFLHLHVKVIS